MSRSGPLLILGMHRSGTSAVTRVINLLGVGLGAKLKASADDNPSGFWEHEDVVAVHEGLLESLGMTWDDPRPLPQDWLDRPATLIAAESIVDIIKRDFTASTTWAVKDPRLCRFVPLWRRLLLPLGMEPRALIVARNPLEVAQSLSRRNRIPDAVGQLLWARHMQEAEAGSRGMRRCLVHYESLLADWPGVMAKVARELELDLDIAPETKVLVDDFLSTTLRHHQQTNDSVTGFVGPLAKALRDQPSSEPAFLQLARAANALESKLQPYLPVIGGLSKMLAAEREQLALKEEEVETTAVALAQSTAWGASRDAELAKTVEHSERLRKELEKSTEWGASRNTELAKTVEHSERLREELEKSTEWGVSRDRELRKMAASLDRVWEEREQLNSELHKRNADVERLHETLAGEITGLRESTRDALTQKQGEVDGLQHQTNLLGARIASLEHRIYTAGPWNAIRRLMSALFRMAKRRTKMAMIRTVELWPGTPERKQARLALLGTLNQTRITAMNGASVLGDLRALAEDRWPARPAYRLRGTAVAEPADLDISVVVHDSERWVDGFMSSLYALDYPHDRIHLHVRDHSAGGATREAFERFVAEYGCPLGTYTFSSGRNAGYGAGHNHNFRLGKSDFFLVTNVDGRFRNDTLRSVLQAAMTSDDAVAAWELRQAPYEHPKYYDPVTMLTTWVSGACVLFRRAAYRQVGGFDDWIFMYGEDVDLSYRLRGRGYRLAYVPGAVYEHDSYSEPQQLKPLQFHGSSLANILLRLRFGTLGDVLAIPRMWRELGRSARQLGLFRGFLRNTARLALVGPVFALSRFRRRSARIPFMRWDYGLRREGAFECAASVASGQQARPLVSIIVRTYRDRADLLRQALASIANQSYPHIQVIVVEDKGAAMREVAESCASAFGLDINYLSCESSDSNRCNTGNIGLAAASGEYVNFLDDDDLFFADHVEYLVSRLSDRPDLGACYALAWEAQVAIDPATGRYQEVFHSSRPDQRIEFDRALMQTTNYIPIQTVLFRRSLFERYGGFNPRLENLEDWDLWRRYSWRHDFQMCPKTTSLYHVPADIERKMARQAVLDEYYPIAMSESAAACEASDH